MCCVVERLTNGELLTMFSMGRLCLNFKHRARYNGADCCNVRFIPMALVSGDCSNIISDNRPDVDVLCPVTPIKLFGILPVLPFHASVSFRSLCVHSAEMFIGLK